MAAIEIRYLTKQDVLGIHERLRKQRVLNALGFNYEPDLDFALDRTISIHNQGVFKPRLVAKAAFLYQALTVRHIFNDGNKRTAFVSCVSFLRRNGHTLNISEVEGYQFTLRIYNEKLREDVIRGWILHNLITW